jgi:hypothetical protein
MFRFPGEGPPVEGIPSGRRSKGVSRAGISAKFHLAVTTKGRIADWGYDGGAFRRLSLGNNSIPVILGRKNQRLAARCEKFDLNSLEFILTAFINSP